MRPLNCPEESICIAIHLKMVNDPNQRVRAGICLLVARSAGLSVGMLVVFWLVRRLVGWFVGWFRVLAGVRVLY